MPIRNRDDLPDERRRIEQRIKAFETELAVLDQRDKGPRYPSGRINPSWTPDHHSALSVRGTTR